MATPRLAVTARSCWVDPQRVAVGGRHVRVAARHDQRLAEEPEDADEEVDSAEDRGHDARKGHGVLLRVDVQRRRTCAMAVPIPGEFPGSAPGVRRARTTTSPHGSASA
jgi:hypothetical protein